MKGVNFWSFIFASQVGAYAMVLIDEMYAKWFGLFGMFPGFKDPVWVIFHQINGTLFAIPFIFFLWNKLPGPGIVKGLIYGVLWDIFAVVILPIIGLLGGAEVFKKFFTISAQISWIILHLAWGGLTGLLYDPEKK